MVGNLVQEKQILQNKLKEQTQQIEKAELQLEKEQKRLGKKKNKYLCV